MTQLQKLAGTCVLVALIALSGCTTEAGSTAVADAQPRETQPAFDEAAEKAAVEAALQRFFDAADAKDWETVADTLAQDFEFFSDGTLTLTRQEFLDAMEGDDMEIEELRLEDVDVTLSADGRMALVRYGAYLESTIGGEPYDMRSAETVVYRKEGDTWRMIHNHASIQEL